MRAPTFLWCTFVFLCVFVLACSGCGKRDLSRVEASATMERAGASAKRIVRVELISGEDGEPAQCATYRLTMVDATGVSVPNEKTTPIAVKITGIPPEALFMAKGEGCSFALNDGTVGIAPRGSSASFRVLLSHLQENEPFSILPVGPDFDSMDPILIPWPVAKARWELARTVRFGDVRFQTCVSLTLSLVSVPSREPVFSLRPIAVELTDGGAGAFFVGSDCSGVSATRFTLNPGTNQIAVSYINKSLLEGTVHLRAASVLSLDPFAPLPSVLLPIKIVLDLDGKWSIPIISNSPLYRYALSFGPGNALTVFGNLGTAAGTFVVTVSPNSNSVRIRLNFHHNWTPTREVTVRMDGPNEFTVTQVHEGCPNIANFFPFFCLYPGSRMTRPAP